ncbi:hypothetical protein C0989_000186 [Termitomyces sp. Mn162]|nr:hypothetical protein C0989_000186 [Termitomyces sp. Mn162]
MSSSQLSEAESLPSFVERIDLSSIASLATAVRERTASISVACTVDPLPKAGAFNVVWFIDFEDNVHWVFRTPQAEWCPMLAKRLRSDIITMKLIQSRTSIPIPLIHDFSVDTNNVIGRPYTFSDRVEGTQLCKLWFDPKWFTEEHRKNVFRSLVSYMVQLRNLEFPSIGCLNYDAKTDSHVVCPLLPTNESILEGDTTVSGPYSTVHAYLLDSISSQISEAPSPAHKISLSLLRLFVGALPDQSLDGPPFVLSMPDYGYQNVFVDDDGHVTGLIDWDDLKLCSRQGGYASYPSWITRDWDPIMYGYRDHRPAWWDLDKLSCTGEENGQDDSKLGDDSEFKEDNRTGNENQLEEEGSTTKEPGKDVGMQVSQSLPIPSREDLQEDSPIVLQGFRDEYLQAFEEVDPVSANYTRNSHIYEAIEIGVSSDLCRGGILDRLMEHVFGYRPTGDGILSTWLLKEGLRRGKWLTPLMKEEISESTTID